MTVTYNATTITVDLRPVDHFAISTIPSPQTATVPITGITITAQDSDNNTLATFTNKVTFSGTAGITGTSASFTAGVLSGFSVTPTVLGAARTFIVTDSVTGKTGTSTFDVNFPSSAKDILTFSFGALGDATITGTDIALAVQNGTAITALAPTYTVSPFATGDPVSGPPSRDFTLPVVYRVTAQDLSTKDYTVTVTVNPPALIGHWVSGEANLADTSGFTPAGTHDGVAVGPSASLLAWSSDVPAGFPGQSLDLTANRVAVLINNTATTDANYRNTFDHGILNRFTAAFWFKGIHGQTWLSKSGNTPYGWMTRPLAFKADFTMQNNGLGETVPSSMTSSNLVNDGNWHHMVAVFDGTASFRQIYVDGVLQAMTTGTPYPVTVNNLSHLMVGATQGNAPNDTIGAFFPGLLYDVRIYSYPLSAPEVAGLHTPGPDILAIEGPVAGQFIITASVNDPASVVTEKTTDLAAIPVLWEPIQTNTVPGGIFFITIPQATDPQAVYRLRQ